MDPETGPLALRGTEGGSWLVRTMSSTHLIDLGGRTATRYPGVAAVTDWDPPSVLRQDADPIGLLQILRCEIGASLALILDVRRDGIPTVRESTLVRSIERVAFPSPGDLTAGTVES